MLSVRKNQLLIRQQEWQGVRSWAAAILGFAAICICPTALTAQQASSAVYVPGNAAVTGFSGALPPVPGGLKLQVKADHDPATASAAGAADAATSVSQAET